MDDDFDRILDQIEEEEELEMKVECIRCGSRFWDKAVFKKHKVVKCSDCPIDWH